MTTKPRTGRLTFRVINNTAAFLSGDLINRILKFITAIWIVRRLSGEEYGQFSFIYVYLSLFEMLIHFGLQSVLTREIAQNPDQAPRILGTAVVFQAFLCLLVIPLAWGAIILLKYPLPVQQGVFLASFQLILTMRLVFDIIYRVGLKMLYPMIWNALRAVMSLIFVLAAAYWRPTMTAFIWAYLASGFAAFTGYVLFTRRFIAMDFRPDFAVLKKIVGEAAPLLFSGYLTLIYFRTDVFMLSKMKTFLDVGYYSVATRLTEALGLIGTSLLVSLFPILSRTFKENRSHFEETVRKAFKVLLILGFPLAVGGSLVSKELTLLLFGKAYLPSAPTLTILLWFTFFLSLGGLLANILIACGKQVIDAWVSLCQVLTNVALNFFLIPKYNYNGAAIATVVTTVVGVVLITIYASRSREIKMPLPGKELRDALRINIPYACILFAMKRWLNLPVIVYILIGAIVYGAFLLLFRVVTWSQVQGYLSHWKKEDRPPASLEMTGGPV